jgi:hypothetical protein
MLLKGSKDNFHKIIWRCECEHPAHSIEFAWFVNDVSKPRESEVFINVTLARKSFWNRFKIGLKYILGVGSDWPYEETMVDAQSIEELISGLQQCVDEIKK